jgi:hypothetical protein
MDFSEVEQMRKLLLVPGSNLTPDYLRRAVESG